MRALTQPQIEALYRDHALGLARFALLLTGDRAAAEDVVQDAGGCWSGCVAWVQVFRAWAWRDAGAVAEQAAMSFAGLLRALRAAGTPGDGDASEQLP